MRGYLPAGWDGERDLVAALEHLGMEDDAWQEDRAFVGCALPPNSTGTSSGAPSATAEVARVLAQRPFADARQAYAECEGRNGGPVQRDAVNSLWRSSTRARSTNSTLLRNHRVCPREQADQLAWLADAVDAGLATTPRGWAHGDFWPGNLLVDAGRFVGVIDWCTAGPGRPAGLDLLNFHLSLHRRRGGERWGPAVVGELLPWARAGGDDLFRAYCQKLGIELDARRLGLLVAAYWLDRISNSVEHYPNRKRRPRATMRA